MASNAPSAEGEKAFGASAQRNGELNEPQTSPQQKRSVHTFSGNGGLNEMNIELGELQSFIIADLAEKDNLTPAELISEAVRLYISSRWKGNGKIKLCKNPECAMPFKPATPWSEYCDPRCGIRNRAKRARQAYQPTRRFYTKACVVCHSQYGTAYHASIVCHDPECKRKRRIEMYKRRQNDTRRTPIADANPPDESPGADEDRVDAR